MNVYLDTKMTSNVLYCINKYKNNKIHNTTKNKKNINQLKIIKLFFTN